MTGDPITVVAQRIGPGWFDLRTEDGTTVVGNRSIDRQIEEIYVQHGLKETKVKLRISYIREEQRFEVLIVSFLS